MYCERSETGLQTYIFVVDELHELELSVGPFRVRHVLKRSGQLLDRNILRSDGVVRRAATTEDAKEIQRDQRTVRVNQPCNSIALTKHIHFVSSARINFTSSETYTQVTHLN